MRRSLLRRRAILAVAAGIAVSAALMSGGSRPSGATCSTTGRGSSHSKPRRAREATCDRSEPGSRRAIAAVAALVLAAGAGGAVAALRSSGVPASARYGQIPSWLPKPKGSVGRVVSASAGHPWRAIEGDTVAVLLAGVSVLATAVGPAVPSEGRFPVPATSPCTFTLTLRVERGRVALRAAAFTIVDELGRLHHPLVRAAPGGALPATVAAGRAVALTLSGVLPTGDGRLRWSPAGARPIVSWDFAVEID
jgi:hypothetical protein